MTFLVVFVSVCFVSFINYPDRRQPISIQNYDSKYPGEPSSVLLMEFRGKENPNVLSAQWFSSVVGWSFGMVSRLT